MGCSLAKFSTFETQTGFIWMVTLMNTGESGGIKIFICFLFAMSQEVC